MSAYPYPWIAADLRPLARPVSQLTNDPKNARLHGDANMRTIMASLRRFGQRKPIVGRWIEPQRGAFFLEVVAGNGTLEAARRLGWTHLAVSVQDMTDEEAAAYALADNRTAELAEWDQEALTATLSELATSMPDFAEDMAFSDEDLAALFPEDEAAAPEEPAELPAPEAALPPAAPVSERGVCYQLGPHRVMCGDATSVQDVEFLLEGVTSRPKLMVTDPPYGVNYDPEWRNEDGLAPGVRLGAVTNDDRASWAEAWQLSPADVAYVWCASLALGVVGADLTGEGFEQRSLIIWKKPSFAISRGHYHWRHEPCWYGVRQGATAKWIGDRKQETVWDIAQVGGFGSSRDANDEQTDHSTQKPVEAMERPIRNHEGDVYDPFLGSGTTLIAAQRQGRTCYGLELNPAYMDVIRARWGAYARAAGLPPGEDAL